MASATCHPSRRGVLAGFGDVLLTAGCWHISRKNSVLLDFARVVSSGDAQIMDRCKALAADPPTRVEDIGFYGLANAPAGERVARGVISVLLRSPYLYDFEDKYIYRMPERLIADGVLKGDPDDPVLNHPLSLEPAFEAETEPDWEAFRSAFPAHVAALTAAAGAAGRHLLSLGLGPHGDTFVLWAATPDETADWLGKVLYRGPNMTPDITPGTAEVTFAVIEPDWARYWDFLTYALAMPEAYWAYPGDI